MSGAWSVLLWMLGKGSPPNGDRTFTDLSLDGLPGGPQTFVAKAAAGSGYRSAYYFLRYIARIG